MTRTEHLLVILMEECNEVAQRASKALRFGLEEVEPGQSLNNAERINLEYADLLAVMQMLIDDYAIEPKLLAERLNAKRVKVEKFLEYSKQCGTYTDTEKRHEILDTKDSSCSFCANAAIKRIIKHFTDNDLSFSMCAICFKQYQTLQD